MRFGLIKSVEGFYQAFTGAAAGAAAGAASRTTETKDPEGDLPGLSVAVAGDDAVVCDLSNINKL